MTTVRGCTGRLSAFGQFRLTCPEPGAALLLEVARLVELGDVRPRRRDHPRKDEQPIAGLDVAAQVLPGDAPAELGIVYGRQVDVVVRVFDLREYRSSEHLAHGDFSVFRHEVGLAKPRQIEPELSTEVRDAEIAAGDAHELAARLESQDGGDT